jgi:hypothetical protein
MNPFDNACPAPRALLLQASLSRAERDRISDSPQLYKAIEQAEPEDWADIAERDRAARREAAAARAAQQPLDSEGMRAQAQHDLAKAAAEYAQLTDGRRDSLFKKTVRLARYVSNGVLTDGEVREALREAATANGALEKHRVAWFEDTITRALEYGKSEPLPPLATRFRGKRGRHAKSAGSPSKRLNGTDALRHQPGATNGADPSVNTPGEPGAKISQVDRLFAFAAELDLFHTSDGTGYADIEVNGHRETWRIKSTGFRNWLRHRNYVTQGSAPQGEALRSAIETLDARAGFDGELRRFFLRVAPFEGHIYVDLGDADWNAIEIGPESWRLVARPPVRFRRAAGMLPLPEPQPGASLETLRQFLNVTSDQEFTLIVSWLLAAINPSGPYPILAMNGEQGSAKSTASRLLRALVDPNDTPLRSLPREERDLAAAGHNGHILAFDNISGLAVWIADSLCRLATGGGFAVRQLYSDNDEVRFNGQRPIILNGIEDICGRPDIADRAILITLKTISEENRKTERELFAEFESERPRLLGALFDAVTRGLKRLPEVKLERLPRMADFALWATACEQEPGAFMKAYDSNRADATALIVDHDPVALAVRELGRS